MATTKGTDITAAIKAANAGLLRAFSAGDANGVAACYTKDAVLMPPNTKPCRGKAIAGFWQGAMDMGVKSASLRTHSVEQHGSTAVETGTVTLKDADRRTLDTGKYVVVWKRENGAWKLHYDIFNSNNPA